MTPSKGSAGNSVPRDVPAAAGSSWDSAWALPGTDSGT